MMYAMELFGIDCEEMIMEEYDSDDSTVIYNSDSDKDNDFDSDSSEENVVDLDFVVENIFYHEERFLDEDKIDGRYYIGLPCLMKSPQEWILQTPIQPQTMLSYNFNHIMRYLLDYSVTRIRNPKMHIMKLDISNTGAYNVVLKTYWLRIVQRTWKRIFKEQQQFIQNCKTPRNILYRKTHGTWENNPCFPRLRGMIRKN